MVEYGGNSVTIMTCSKCNTKCDHCYLGYNCNFDNNDLYEMTNNLSKKYKVDLNGSEILLFPKYLESFSIIGQDRILTNGLAIYNNPNLMIELMSKNICWVCISYHFELHERISKIPPETIFSTISMLKQNDFKVEIMTTISLENFNDIDNMVNEAVNMKADCIRFTNFLNIGNAKNMSSCILSDAQIEKFFDQFYKAKVKYGKEILVRRSGTFSRDMRKNNSRFYCPAIENKVAITPDNKVYPCPFLVSNEYEIGEYVDGKILINSNLLTQNDVCLAHQLVNRKI